MTSPNEIKEYIKAKIKGQGNQTLSSHLVKVLNEMVDMLSPVSIIAESNTTINGYSVPELTAEQVVMAYNAVVAGKGATITDANGKYHLVVDQADLLDNEPSVGVLFWNVMLITYVVSGNYVNIEHRDL